MGLPCDGCQGLIPSDLPVEPRRALALPAQPQPPRARPLEGIRVIDFTWVYAGPFATRMLGYYGAEVIRLDNPNLFPTATRGVVPRPRPGHEADLGQL